MRLNLHPGFWSSTLSHHFGCCFAEFRDPKAALENEDFERSLRDWEWQHDNMEKLAEQLHTRRIILRLLGIGVLLIDDLSILGPMLPSTRQIRYMQSRRWIKAKPLNVS